MNKERLLEIASDLREDRMPLWKGRCTHFDMRRTFEVPYQRNGNRVELNFCGTICCIAGIAAIKYEPVPEENQGSIGPPNLVETAKRVLDLDEKTAERLFFPKWLDSDVVFDTTDRLEAAKVIENLVATGEVSWGEEKDQEDEYDND